MVKPWVIKGGAVALAPGKKILKAEEYAAMAQSSSLLEVAHREAERIIAQAQQDAQSMRQKGYQDGLREGKQKIAEKMLETIQRTVDYMASSEEKICDLVVMATRRIIGDMDDRSRIVRIVQNALSVVRSQKHVIIKVNPQDLGYVKNEIHTFLSQFQGMDYLEVVADERLAPQSCILESDMGIVDASVEVQLGAIRNALMKTVRRNS